VRKEKRVAKRERARDQRQEAANHAGSDAHGQAPAMPGANRKKRHTAHAVPLPVALVLDCGFDELMTEKEIVSLSNQITRCYADMSMAGDRAAKLVVAGFDGRVKERFDTVLQGHYRNWKGVEVHENPLPEALKSISFSQESI
jgi:tRNA (guanine9-N1)-methyltransferase